MEIMARRIIASEFDLTARRLAVPTLNVPRRLTPEQRGWDFTQHRSIKDCVPVRDFDIDDIQTPAYFEASRKTILYLADSGHYKYKGKATTTDLHSFTKGYCRHIGHYGMMCRKDQTKTIKGRREEVVRETRRLRRDFKSFVLKNIDLLDRKDF